MGMSVVTVASGGMPVVEATSGTPVTEATNGYGMRVTKVVGKPGMPVTFETIGLSGGGGVTAPAWVPTDARVYIDLVREFSGEDAAWTAADGVVEVDTLLGGDPNTDNYGTTTYDPINLYAAGYAGDTAYIGAARTLALAGATLVHRLYKGSSAQPSLILAMSTDYNYAINIQAQTNTAAPNNKLRGFSDTGTLNIATTNTLNLTAGSINVLAATFVMTRLDLACNGSPAVSGVLGSAERPPGNPLSAVLIDVGSSNRIQSITLYNPLPTTAGLSALSVVS